MAKMNNTTRKQIETATKALQDRGIKINYLQKTPGGLWRLATNGHPNDDITGKTARELIENAWARCEEIDAAK